jgi:hypothetical protein
MTASIRDRQARLGADIAVSGTQLYAGLAWQGGEV